MAAFWVFLSLGASSVAFVFRHVPDVWTGMAGAMGAAFGGTLAVASVRRRLKPSVRGILLGLAGGALQIALTGAAIGIFRASWPGWESHARVLDRIRGTHGWAFVAPTLGLIVLGEEAVWRGVVSRFLMERWGRGAGVALGAALYALAHVVTLNPLLAAAALGGGLYWGLLYAATDGLVAPTVSHLLWDLFLLGVVPGIVQSS